MEILAQIVMLVSIVGIIYAQERQRRLHRSIVDHIQRGAFCSGVMFAMDRVARGVDPDRLIEQAKDEVQQPAFDASEVAQQIASSPSSIFHAA